MNNVPELPPAATDRAPPKPHPVDIALAALSEVAAGNRCDDERERAP